MSKPGNWILMFLFLLTLFSPIYLSAQSQGPLLGKNLYLPHLAVFGFSGTQPLSEEKGWEQNNQLYWVNEFFLRGIPTEGVDAFTTDPDPDQYLHMDYESLVWEESLSYSGDFGRLSLTLRLFCYYPGFADPLIESFHGIFGFPNGGRGYFPANRLFLNLQGTSGPDSALFQTWAGLGDTELLFQRSLVHWGSWDFSWSGAISLPTGIRGLSGSGYPDLGVQLVSLYSGRKNYFHIQSGLVLPGALLFDDKSQLRLCWQNLLGWEYAWRPHLSLLTQFQLNTSPLTSPYYRKVLFWDFHAYQVMQTNLRLGCKWAISRGTFQFYIEEDPITFEGADILVSLGYTHRW